MTRCLAAAAIVASLLATGCTMCPDPFDYSGPVPNGSVTQNDFAARSNGTRPVRATPLPWPPIVESSRRQPTPADEPDTTVLVAAVQPAAADHQLAAGSESATGSAAVADPTTVAVEHPLPSADDAAAVAAVSPESEAEYDREPVVTAPRSDAPGTVAEGVVPPQGRWMTSSRRLPPPGNIPPPAERKTRRNPATPEPTWREATRSLLRR